MPREPKPPAIPIKMPRTEGDLDKLMAAIEKHAAEGGRLGQLLNERKLSPKQVLAQAADADEKLYDTMDAIQKEREADMEAIKLEEETASV